MNEQEIVKLYLNRDEQAIAESEKKYHQYLYSIAYGILRCYEDSEEAENDTYVGAWNSIPPHMPERLSGFLGKITRRIAIKMWEKRTALKRGGDTEVSKDGNVVRIYTMPSPDQDQRYYLYDVPKNKFSKVKQYSGKFERIVLKDVTDVAAPDALSVYGPTYELQDGSRITYSIHIPEDDAPPVYGDLYLIGEEDGKVKEYTIFQ